MVDFPVSQTRVPCGGSNESFACEFGETARRNAAWQERRREFKEKLLQICIGMVLRLWRRFSAPKTRVAIDRVGDASRCYWKAFLGRFQGSLNTSTLREVSG